MTHKWFIVNIRIFNYRNNKIYYFLITAKKKNIRPIVVKEATTRSIPEEGWRNSKKFSNPSKNKYTAKNRKAKTAYSIFLTYFFLYAKIDRAKRTLASIALIR